VGRPSTQRNQLPLAVPRSPFWPWAVPASSALSASLREAGAVLTARTATRSTRCCSVDPTVEGEALSGTALCGSDVDVGAADGDIDLRRPEGFNDDNGDSRRVDVSAETRSLVAGSATDSGFVSAADGEAATGREPVTDSDAVTTRRPSQLRPSKLPPS
jgi:hypothetical protein